MAYRESLRAYQAATKGRDTGHTGRTRRPLSSLSPPRKLLIVLLAGLARSPASAFLRAPARGADCHRPGFSARPPVPLLRQPARGGLCAAAAMCRGGRVDRDSTDPAREHAETEQPAPPLRGLVARFGVGGDGGAGGGDGGAVYVGPSGKGGLGLFASRDVAAGEVLASVPRRTGDDRFLLAQRA